MLILVLYFIILEITHFSKTGSQKLNHCFTSPVYHEAGERHTICFNILSMMPVFIWLNTVLSVFVEVIS